MLQKVRAAQFLDRLRRNSLQEVLWPSLRSHHLLPVVQLTLASAYRDWDVSLGLRGDSCCYAVDAQLDLSANPEETQQFVTLRAPLNDVQAWLELLLRVTKRRSLH